MTWVQIASVPPQYQKSDGTLASGYYIKFYDTTNTAINMASAGDGSGLLAKAQLDASGYPLNGSADIFTPFIDQEYKVALYQNATDADADTTVNADWFIGPYVPYSAASGIGSATASINTIALLRAVTGQANNQAITLLGHTTVGDGGGGIFYYVSGAAASTYTDDDGITIVPTGGDGSAAWIRDFDGDLISTKWYGAVVDGVTDDTTATEAARDYCITNDTTLYGPDGLHYFAADLDLWGVKKILFRGSITFPAATNKVTVGGNTSSAPSLDINLYETNGIIYVYGMNRGNLKFVQANKLHLYASDAVANRNTVSYSRFEFVNVDTLHLECQDTVGGAPWINENMFFCGRVRLTLTMDGTYPMNNNKFYGIVLESCTVDIQDGHSNMFHDVRLEGSCTFTFASGTFNNMFWQTWSNFANTMMWDVDSGTYTITDNGDNNRIVSAHHAYIEKDSVVSYDAQNLDNEEIFSAGTTDTTKLKVLRNAAIFFDTGLIPATDKLWFNVYCGASSPASLRIFMSPYDGDGALITTEPTNYKASQGSTSWNGAGYWEYTSDVAGGSFATNPNADAAVKYIRCWARTANGAANNELNFLRAEVIQPQQDKYPVKNAAPTAAIDVISNRVTSTAEATALDLFKFTSNSGSTVDAAGILSGQIYFSLTAEKGSIVDAASAVVQFQVAREDTSGVLTITTGTPTYLSNGGTLQINAITLATKAGASATEAIMTIAIGTNSTDPFDELNCKARLVGLSDYMGDSIYLIDVEKV